MKQIIDLSRSVYEISKENPEIIDIMKELGFHDITTPGMLNTAGRFMTIPKGAAMKKISMDIIKNALIEKGYHIKEKIIE